MAGEIVRKLVELHMGISEEDGFGAFSTDIVPFAPRVANDPVGMPGPISLQYFCSRLAGNF